VKVLHLNTSDIVGGAARAAYRLHRGLLKSGVDSQMLVQKKHGDKISIVGPKTKPEKEWALLRPEIDKLPLKIFKNNQQGPWSVNWFPTNIVGKIKKINPDVVHLHWIGNGMISIRELSKIKKPIIWTMHDMWPFTGGFHLSSKYINHDGSWISKHILKQKIKYWRNLNLTLVSPSKWLAKQAKESKLFKDKEIEVIPNGLDTKVFKPIPHKIARNILNLPQDKKIILFGAMGIKDKNKGFDLLTTALKKIQQRVKTQDYLFLVFGGSRPQNNTRFKIKTKYLGRIYDEANLALIYSSANVFVIPSRQENLPNTIMEAMACGTTCVGFNIGGIPDMINHKKNGYLAKSLDVENLVKGINFCLSNKGLGSSARKKAENEYSLELQTKRYKKLYNKLVG